ncbi:MAG TPA: hypothetical protein VFE08_15835 [Candidatus Sulfotelmatobacter sp.]|nr:hypothetical protein [Candidatus Sulfotelmatobacter sp.]
MELKAVITARFLGFVELATLNPGGKVFFPAVVPAIVEKFDFQKYPTTFEQFDESKGVEFFDGQWDGVNVSKLTIYNNGLLVDTQSSTDDSERIVIESLAWASKKFGITFNPKMIYRRRYLSDIVFSTDVPILDGFAPIDNLRKNLSDMMESVIDERLQYAAIRLDVDFERFQRPAPIAPLTIQRRNDYAFADDTYFSEAPLPTSLHLALVEEYEKDILAKLAVGAKT